MKHCANCGIPQRRQIEFVLRPSTPDEIAEAEVLRKRGGERDWSRADMLASVYHDISGERLEDGAVTDGKMKLRRVMNTLETYESFPYGAGLFCRIRCAEEFAVFAYRNGLRKVEE